MPQIPASTEHSRKIFRHCGRAHGAVLLLLALAACSGPAPETRSDGNMTSAGAIDNSVLPEPGPAANVAQAAAAPVDYAGRWVGVEGMYLDITAAGTPGRFRLAMQWDLDNKGTFEGTAKGDTIVFERNGVGETLRPTDGDATGLKYLAGKTTCLTVKPGEGYCRK
ncbi:hypothetical protein [Sphingomonas sp. R86521]|uniref:hypothetical protein n=1 Tax=Sphingomonas sp. R86521 TaxID=3093860 RepID=UPI0036D2250C